MSTRNALLAIMEGEQPRCRCNITALASMKDYLNSVTIQRFGLDFIPKTEFNKIMKLASIIQVLYVCIPDFSHKDAELYANVIWGNLNTILPPKDSETPDQEAAKAPKASLQLFATLILCGEVARVPGILNAGFSDQSLPIILTGDTNENTGMQLD